MKESKFRLGSKTEKIRKKLSSLRIMRQQNRLSREVVDAPSLQMFKIRLDGALSNVV